MGDPTRVRQIVSNLLSNALKFTRVGRVDLRVTPAGDQGVVISVRDTGIGISAEALPKLFQPFAQGGAGIARQFGGTGLGLALTRRLCEAMEGRLQCIPKKASAASSAQNCPCSRTPPPCCRRPSRDASWPCALPAAACRTCSRSGCRSGASTMSDATPTLLDDGPWDQVITDAPEQLPRLREAGPTPILLVTGYGSFLPAERAAPLAPLQQLARPISRSTLYQALHRSLHPHEHTAQPSSEQRPRPHHSARVLLVEDNAVNQLVAKGMLSKLGCEVLVASHGGEALEVLAREPVELVLMDCNMPIMDGYEATRRIRQSGQWPGLPIVALTANALPDERERCRAAGMDDYLAKPFRREDLVTLLDNWLPATQPTR